MIEISSRIPDKKAKRVFGFFHNYRTVSKMALLEWSGLSLSTLTRTIEDLIKSGAIMEVGFGESKGGRKPILYEINPSFAYVFGLEISRSVSKLALFDLQFNVLDSESWVMTEESTPERLIRQVTEAVERMMSAKQLNSTQILGMGIGSVGPLDRKKGVILEPMYFPSAGWHNIEICRLFSEKLDFPIHLDHGANVSLLGELWYKNGESRENVIYLHAGVGVRAAIMAGGKMVYGAVEYEGSIGQMIIQTDGIAPRKENHNYGSLESYVSIDTLVEQAKSFLKQGRTSRLSEIAKETEKVQFSHILQALQENDPLTREIMTQAGTLFGIGIANVINLLHPQEVILGGPLIVTNDLFYDAAVQTAMRKTRFYPSYPISFSKGQLGENAIAFGAALLTKLLLSEL